MKEKIIELLDDGFSRYYLDLLSGLRSIGNNMGASFIGEIPCPSIEKLAKEIDALYKSHIPTEDEIVKMGEELFQDVPLNGLHHTMVLESWVNGYRQALKDLTNKE